MTAKDGSPIAVFAIDLGGAFMNSREHPNQSQGFEKSLLKFGKLCVNTAIDEEIKAEQKILKSLENDQKSLEEKLSDYEKDIINYTNQIKETEKKISDVKSNQEKKKDDLKTQKSKIESIEKKRKTLD
jgi:chromosome segregation ATPase